jgi:hypothetical protein
MLEDQRIKPFWNVTLVRRIPNLATPNLSKLAYNG